MRRILLTLGLAVSFTSGMQAQDTAGVRALTMDEYEKAKAFTVGDPDKDTYVKFDNTYVLDHHAFGKPYFITGDDGKRKRIDLYKLSLKEGRIELGTVIFYTTENGKRYSACMPGYKADPKIWRKYFEDIHAIDKVEPFFVLKLSYVLSEELGFQLYRAGSGQQGAAVSREEAGTYGNDICFPGDMRVTMGDGTEKPVSAVQAGDVVVAVDPATRTRQLVRVKELTVHPVKNYAITRLMLVSVAPEGGAGDARGREGCTVRLSSRVLEATPNHPMMTAAGERPVGGLKAGDRVICLDGRAGKYVEYTVWEKTEAAGGRQPVYNIVAGGGSTFIMNGVMVMQKPGR